MNTLRTLVLMGFLAALMVAVGGVLAGKSGLIAGFVIALIMNFTCYWFSDKIAIAQDGAQPVSQEEAPELYEIVEHLCQEAKLPMPRIYISPKESPNAFATGRDPEHSAVAVTVGILRILNRQELEAVLAHELGHVLNRDVLITTIGSVMAATITSIAHFGMYGFGYRRDEEGNGGVNPIFAIALMILAPIAATLINLAVSRSREYEADATGARLCHHPEALANALAKLEEGTQMRPMSGVNPAFGNIYTVKPDGGNWMTNLMSTHPPIAERIKRLQEMEMLRSR